MLTIKKLLLVVLFCISTLLMYAQEMNTTAEDPTDFMRSNGKLYVVIAVILVIVIGLFIYLFTLDRKITKLEKGEIDK